MLEMPLGIIFFLREGQVSSTQKVDKKKTDSVGHVQKRYRKLRTMLSQKQKKHKARDEIIQRYVSINFP